MGEKKLTTPQEILDALESINMRRGYLMNQINEKKEQVHLMEGRLKDLEIEGSAIYDKIVTAEKQGIPA